MFDIKLLQKKMFKSFNDDHYQWWYNVV